MTMTKEELIIKTAEWARERGLHLGNYQMQVLKLTEELGELIGAHLKLKKGPSDEWSQVQKDSVGDMAVVMGVIRAILIEGDEMSDEIWAGEPNKSPFNDLPQWHALPIGSSEYLLHEIINVIGDTPFNPYGGKRIATCMRRVWEKLQLYCISEHLDIYECWELAYNEVAQRKGKTVNGLFIKNGD